MRWLQFPRALWLALLAAAALSLPSVAVGRAGEDTAQLLAAEGSTEPWRFAFSRFDAFAFADGRPDRMAALRQAGAMPWWTLLEFKVAFWRPLSSALMVLDRAVFGRSAALAHLHSVAWGLALVAAGALLFRGVLMGALGGLALLLFAIDDAHAVPTIWLANRNALVSATFAVLAVAAHVRWRERGDRRLLPASLGAMAAALLAGEIALGFLGYVVAYEAAAGPGGPARRLGAAAPMLALGTVYLAVYKALGYGAAWSTLYVDPSAQPLEWAANVVPRLSVLFAAVTVGFPADLWMAAPARPFLVVVALLSLGGLGLFARAAWRELSAEEGRHLRWLAAGAALSLVPATATSPSNRLLVAGSLGGAALVAVMLRHALRRRGPALAVLAALALFHVLLPPLAWAGMSFAFSGGHARSERIHAALAGELDPARVADQRLVALWSDPFTTMSAPARWVLDGNPSPRAFWSLSLAPAEHVYTRSGPSSLDLELAEGRILGSEVEYFCRPPWAPPLESVALDGLSVEVLDRDAEGIRRVRFTFDRPLEDPSLVLLQWRDGVMRAQAPPPVGGQLRVAPQPPL